MIKTPAGKPEKSSVMKRPLFISVLPLAKITLLLAIFLGNTACKPEEQLDTVPPGPVSNISVTPTHGGAIISYDKPDDEDLLMVKAVYTNSQGEEVFKVASFYEDFVEIEGFNDTLSHPVSIYAVDRSNNHSEPVIEQVSPLVSHIYLVQESVVLQPDLGGVKIKWENIEEKTVFVYLTFTDGITEFERILSSDNALETFIVRGMDSVLYDFYTQVEDFSGNKTETLFEESLKPLFEEKIDKSTWLLVPALSVDGNAWEGETVNFWDDIIDTKETQEDNSYFIISRDQNGGMLNFPLDIVVDFDKKVVVNRFAVWQRAYWYTSDGSMDNEYYYYQPENMRSFDLFASNDKLEWLLLGSFDIGNPSNEDGEIPPGKIQEAIDGHEFELDATSEPFQYLKFSITSSFGSVTNVYGSEITLYGLDNASE